MVPQTTAQKHPQMCPVSHLPNQHHEHYRSTMKFLFFHCTFAYSATFLLSSLPSLSSACKCIPPNLTDSLYNKPDSTVFAGRIVDELTTSVGSYDRYFVFKLNRVFKACSAIQAADLIIVSTSFSSASCGLDLIPNTQYIFSAHAATEDNQDDLPIFSVGSCDYNAEWSAGVSDEDKRALRLYLNTTQSNAHCDSSSKCQTGADCDQTSEYCDVSNNKCVTIDAPCPSFAPPVACFAAPCTVTDPCQEADGPLTCLDSYCGGCKAIFLDADRSQVCNS